MDGKLFAHSSRSAARALLGCAVLVGASGAVAQQCQPLVAESTLYAFTEKDGPPSGGLIFDSFGALYGLNEGSSYAPYGTAFKLTPPVPPATSWTKSVIYAAGDVGGVMPIGSLTLGVGGALYGLTQTGGSGGRGTVFRLTPPVSADQPWTETVLYDFPNERGSGPVLGLVVDSFGGVYGLMGNSGFGAVFEVPPNSSSAITLYEFPSILAGSGPVGPLVFGPQGALYGATGYGGAADAGTVFKLTPPVSGSGPWTESVLYSFSGGADGALPSSGLTLSADGSLYGATTAGGNSKAGAVFKLTPPASGTGRWSQTVVHSFSSGGADGGYPFASVIIDPWGALYGVAGSGGPNGSGLVFKLTPPVAPSTTWTHTVLHAFNGADGAHPQGQLVFDHNGGLYGTTTSGGPNGNGVAFKLQMVNSPPGCL